MESGMKYAKKIKAVVFKPTSAKEREGIDELFMKLAIKLYQKEIGDREAGVSYA
jgi:translation initiation factor IF-2